MNREKRHRLRNIHIQMASRICLGTRRSPNVNLDKFWAHLEEFKQILGPKKRSEPPPPQPPLFPCFRSLCQMLRGPRGEKICAEDLAN